MCSDPMSLAKDYDKRDLRPPKLSEKSRLGEIKSRPFSESERES
jgi:hypothetical protein